MAESELRPADLADASEAGDRLDSWKEIAAYLKRDVTTVRRWEKREDLPVHRHLHERRDSVYAYSTEIDRWWAGRRNHLADNGLRPPALLPGADDGASLSPVDTETRRLPRIGPAWSLAAAFFLTSLVLAAVLVVRNRPGAAGHEAELRFSMLPPEGTSFASVSLSPDGRQLAFTTVPVSIAGGSPLLWIRSLDTLEARALPDTEGATYPFWSPASDALGFFADGHLWIVDLAGADPRAVAPAPNGRGGTWNRDGVIVFAPDRLGALFRVSANGGEATAVTTVDQPNERGHVWPEFLPDGNHFLYLADSNTPEYHNLFVGALDSQERKVIIPGAATSAAYAASGHVLFARDRQLVAQPFDTGGLTLTGEPVSLVEALHQPAGGDHKMDFSVSSAGVLMYRTRQSPATRLIWRDRTRALSTLISLPAEYTEPLLSPDQTRIAVDLFDPKASRRFGYGVAKVRSDIWIVDASTGAGSQFTADPAADWGPVWSPDGTTIVFSSNRTDRLELYQASAHTDGRDAVRLASEGMNPVAQSWSPDGKFVLYTAFDPKSRFDLWLLPMSGDRAPLPLLRSESSEEQGQISPDGRWFAYTSNESGRSEVYVQTFPVPSTKHQISTNGGGDPRWRPDGKELFYVTEDRRFMAVPVKTAGGFTSGPAVSLFETGMPPHWYEARNLYDVSRDGRFLFMTPVEDDRSSPFTVVVNWAAGLRR